ncbi:MAG: hypothetical protein Q8891_13705 [Bacteroidota bacterium]|nr:hypothetical protein [Bacteroidota bacterium]
MKQAKLSINFVPLTDSDFRLKVTLILESMAGNAYFPNPSPALSEIRENLNQYNQFLIEAQDMSRMAIANKKQTRKTLEQQLAQLALYIMHIAQGNETMLVSSGFTLYKKPESIHISAPGNVTLTSGMNSGELTSSIKAVKGAKCYLFEITPDPITDNSLWQVNNSSRRKFTFTRLKQGQRYWVRIAALGSGQQKVYSDPAYQWVQ